MADVGMPPSRKAETFHSLHRQATIFVLANAWDVITARTFEDCGFAAIGTTSFGIARAHGLKDGENAAYDVTLSMVRRMAAALSVPLSVDFEGGFAATPEAVKANGMELIAAGAVGFNLEDGQASASSPLADPMLHAEKIAALKQAGREAGVPVFVNARTDVLWLSVGEPVTRFDECLRRAEIYTAAGADGIFIPKLSGREEIAQAVQAIRVPLNLLASPATPPLDDLAALGVKRVSLGSGPARAMIRLLSEIGRELLGQGSYEFLNGAPSYDAANRM